MPSTRQTILLLTIGLCLTAGASRQAAAQTTESFYKGKTINFLVASVPGGVNDLTARLIARHLGKHIPGDPNIVVQNLQSSGLALINRIYNTPDKDGLRSGSSSAAHRRSPSWATPTRASTRSRSPGSAACRPTATMPTACRSIRVLCQDGGRPAHDRPPVRQDRLDRRGRDQRHLHQHRARRSQAQHPARARLSRRRRRLPRAAAHRARRPGRRRVVDEGRTARAVAGRRVPAAGHVRSHHAVR